MFLKERLYLKCQNVNINVLIMKNKVIKIAVVEDCIEDMNNCLSLLDRYSKEKGVNFDIESFSSGDSFSLHFRSQFDFIILDINLSLTNGIEVARDIRTKDEKLSSCLLQTLQNTQQMDMRLML